MAEEFGARDIFVQLDARLTNVEQDLRGFRSEVRGEFATVRSEISALSRWGLGMLFGSWVTVIASIWLKQ